MAQHDAGSAIERRSLRGSEIARRTSAYLILAVLGAVVFFPFYYMITASLMNQEELFTIPRYWLPPNWRFYNYISIFEISRYGRWFLNTSVITAIQVIASVFFCSLAGFAFAKLSFRGRNTLFGIVMATMFVPFFAILIPLYRQMAVLGWLDSLLTVIIPGLVGPFGVFLMRQYMVTIPTELMDAARVDGATGFQIFRQVAFPLALPAVATLGVLNFLGSWTSFQWPLIVLQTVDKYTLVLGLYTVAGAAMTGVSGLELHWEHVMAGTVIMSAPLAITFLVLQRYFLGGLTFGAIKG